MLDWYRSAGRLRRLLLLLALPGLVLATLPAAGAVTAPDFSDPAVFDFQSEVRGTGDVDLRAGAVAPTTAQRQAVDRLGARVTWNTFGTPAVLIASARGGDLGKGSGAGAVAVARSWLAANRQLFRLSEAGVRDLDLVLDAPIGAGHAVTFRQRFDGVPAVSEGMVTLAVRGDRVLYASSSLAADGAELDATALAPERAWKAAAGPSFAGAEVRVTGRLGSWTKLEAEGAGGTQLVRLGALPTPQGPRLVRDAVVMDTTAGPEGIAVREIADARSGQVLVRDNLVDYHHDDPEGPRWTVFPAFPELDYSSRDTRELWCWSSRSRRCDREVENPASPQPWDVHGATGLSSNTTLGNNAHAVEKWNSFIGRDVGTEPATPRPDRNYTYEWTNQWFEERCNPSVFTSERQNDIDAARANLFVMHNRMHDWSYHLGFTEQTFNLQEFNYGRGGLEGDPEQGNAQAGGIVGGPPFFRARDNANQFTPPDGVAPITNMFLWQPIAGAFYAPCVDGDYDQAVIGHEYSHAISNRMVAGPDDRLRGDQAGAMGESWSDMFSMEYLNELDLVPVGRENPFAVGAYVTGDPQAAIRNYGMNFSPLNYSDIGYDLTGTQVHADGEIWSSINFDLREAFIDEYRRFPARSDRLQRECALGRRPVDRCPGNRRWVQLHFDALLLMQSRVSMVDARDALLAADLLRFNGANQELMWDVFASGGLGEGAFSDTNEDPQPVPSFASPLGREGTVRLEPRDAHGDPVAGARLFVGHYEARVTPVADTDPATPLGDEVAMVPGRYDLIVQAPGHGAERLHRVKVRAGRTTELDMRLATNLASAANGATASGDGVNQASLIDDTEATNWASLGEPVGGQTVTVQLDPSRPWHRIGRVQVSAALRPENEDDPGGDTGSQSRFSALRQFQLFACVRFPWNDCTQDSDFRLVYTSPDDAFPSVQPRPRQPDLIMRSFNIPNTWASVLRFRVVTNQCTGGPDFQGDQDDDPINQTDCSEASSQATNVRAAELQVFRR